LINIAQCKLHVRRTMHQHRHCLLFFFGGHSLGAYWRCEQREHCSGRRRSQHNASTTYYRGYLPTAGRHTMIQFEEEQLHRGAI
jgi:hypothetical protein